MDVRLRDLADGDLDRLFRWERDPAAVALAAFTRADPSDRAAFDRHYERIRADPTCTVLAVEHAGSFVGTIGSFTMDGEREVTYWVDPSLWGRGTASSALAAFLTVERERPLRARVAVHNVGSATVLVRAGFVEEGRETSYAPGVGSGVVEQVYRLDP
ncbi:GNAT family N-acetyltransferase [Cellulosimicrobium cellulans]|uniref:GNAT family N-acetyltransferase n=1 Tax=Cellulosimicrobium cellulans TaxID=1710 RepID=UPI001EDAF979|nr:GNAT family N-acetyltransferase [Cellulosimicrobium cellulans]UKJ63203.1 GNAT family N-acetyltransferase [Cellulosimicrobium cellulans]